MLFSSELFSWKQLSFKGVKYVANTAAVPIEGLVRLTDMRVGFVSATYNRGPLFSFKRENTLLSRYVLQPLGDVSGT